MTDSLASLQCAVQIALTLIAAWSGIALSVFGAIAAITGNPFPPAPPRVSIALIIAAAGAALCAAALYLWAKPLIADPLTIPALIGALTFSLAALAINQSLPIARYHRVRGELPFDVYPNDYANSLNPRGDSTPHNPR